MAIKRIVAIATVAAVLGAGIGGGTAYLMMKAKLKTGPAYGYNDFPIQPDNSAISSISGITSFMENARKEIDTKRAEKLNKLLIHSRNVIDAFQYGTSENTGYEGDYNLSAETAKNLIADDYQQFQALFGPELNSIRAKTGGKLQPITGSEVPLFSDLSDLKLILCGIDSALSAAVRDCSAGGYSRRIKSNPNIYAPYGLYPASALEDDRMRLETYRQYLFNSKINLLDVPKATQH